MLSLYKSWKEGVTHFSKPGDFCRELVDAAEITLLRIRGDPDPEDIRMATEIMEEYNKADDAFKALPPKKMPFEEFVKSGNYEFKAQDWLGRYVVDVKRPTIDRLYITLSVRYEGNFWDDAGNVKIIGYCIFGTNGSVTDCREAAAEMLNVLNAYEKESPTC
jgi:hypothetical protein